MSKINNSNQKFTKKNFNKNKNYKYKKGNYYKKLNIIIILMKYIISRKTIHMKKFMMKNIHMTKERLNLPIPILLLIILFHIVQNQFLGSKVLVIIVMILFLLFRLITIIHIMIILIQI